MFEKEAKKWVKEHTEIEYKASYGEFPKEPSAIKSFKAGAEFGYNKAKEEMQEIGLALQSDMDKTIEQNIALKKQIEKLEKFVPKTCENCVGYSCHAICVDCDFKDKWEVKE